MFNSNHNPAIKQALYNNKKTSAVEYFKDVNVSMISHFVNTSADRIARDVELLDWNCAFCQNVYKLNIFDYKKLKYTDFLCKKCVDFPKTNALNVNIMKSSNNLMILLKNKLNKNFKTNNHSYHQIHHLRIPLKD